MKLIHLFFATVLFKRRLSAQNVPPFVGSLQWLACIFLLCLLPQSAAYGQTGSLEDLAKLPEDKRIASLFGRFYGWFSILIKP